jgi:hypothetical protein
VVGSSGEGVQGLISSLNTTTPRSISTKLVAWNLALMLLDKKTPWYTALNAARNASLSIQLMLLFTRAPTLFLYTRFNSEKHLMSRG